MMSNNVENVEKCRGTAWGGTSVLHEEEAEFLPEETLFSKTENGSMERELFVEWLKHSVVQNES
jgi:hypothetical protein